LSEADIRKTVDIVRGISDEAKARSQPRLLRRTTAPASVKSGV
jgi:hypothetical protein